MLVISLFLLAGGALAFTQKSEVERLTLIRDASLNKSLNWQKALISWTCESASSNFLLSCWSLS